MSKQLQQFKLYWKRFGSYNQIRFVKSSMYFLVGMLGLILLSAFSQKLSMLDTGLAKWAQANASEKETSWFNTGVIYFVNEKQTPLFLIAFSFLIVLVGFDLLVLRLRFKTHKGKYLYILFGMLGFVAISTIEVQVLKSSFHRPRPKQTIEYHSPLDTDDKCKVPFQIGFRKYTGPNPCDYQLRSCPSGHTQGTATACFIMLWFAIFNYKFTKQYNSSVLNTIFNACMIFLAACLTVIFIPSVMIARISVFMHFFTDVFGGLCLTVLAAFVLPLFEPELTNESVLDDREKENSFHMNEVKSADTVQFAVVTDEPKLDSW
ncbi:PAP2_superfamily protein [Hexamita inflata]|uniref:PAP2 superfamily protein n=3 Tax=Hexamita inflata TaxID=28002 RepID=A0AA86UQ52_9EUKA|nr:PAP2 superfamily protein [Hexamita inflata]